MHDVLTCTQAALSECRLPGQYEHDSDVVGASCPLLCTHLHRTLHKASMLDTYTTLHEPYNSQNFLAGSNAFRLSLEWSRIMPRKGQIDQAAVKRYHQMFDCIDK